MRANAIMPVTMAKFLALGMPLREVIYRSTWKPAQVIRRPELGHLTPSSEADIAVLELHQGSYGFTDSGGARIQGSHNLTCQMTLRAGNIVWDLNARSRPSWQDAGDYRQLN